MNNPSNTNEIVYGISKYKNIYGITCYMNSILHILQQIPIFVDYIFIAPFVDILKEKMKNNESAIRNTVSYELFQLFKVSLTHDDNTITPTSFKRTIGDKDSTWNELNHQDSQQFLNFLISKLEEEIGIPVLFLPGNINFNDINNKKFSILPILANISWNQNHAKEFSPLKDIFNGMTLIKNTCGCCSNISNNFDSFNTLQLSIPLVNPIKEIVKEFTIFDCLEHMIKEEQFDKDNLYNCELCGFKNRGFTSRQLWRTPKILIIHIKRFLIDNYGNKTKKLINNITYPIYDFNISKYINDESPYKNKSNYNLIGINLHQEFTSFGTNSGHYTSLVKNRYDNNWYLFNDEHEPIKAINKDALQNRNAYLLFYYRDN